MKRKQVWLLILTVLTLAVLAFGAADGSWLRHVPAKRPMIEKNHYEGQADAVAAGTASSMRIIVPSAMERMPKSRRNDLP